MAVCIFLLLLVLQSRSQLAVTRAIPDNTPYTQLRFEKFDFRQGLSHPNITCIYQDKSGFLWVGTPFGLNRYNGIRFENFFHQPGKANSLHHNSVHSITEDKDQLLWIGTTEGISCFNPRTNQFINSYAAMKDIQRFSKGRCMVYADENNNLWIGSHVGIAVLNVQRTALKEIKDDLAPTDPVNKGAVIGFTEDAAYVWASTSDGFYRIHKKTFVAEPVGNNEYRKSFLRISKDSKGRIWSCTWGGEIVWWDPADQQLHHKTVKEGSTMDVLVITEGQKEWIYITTFDGLIKMELGNFLHQNSYSFYQPHKDDAFSISHRILSDIFADRDQNIWIGSDNGLNRVDPASLFFSVFSYSHFNTDLPFHAFCTTQNPNEYYALAGSHVFSFNRQKGITEDVNFGSKYECYDLFRQADTYWMTFNGGLLQLNSQLKIQAHYKLPYPETFPQNRLRWVVEDNEGMLWISTARTGVVVFDPQKKTFLQRFNHNADKLNTSGHYIEDMLFDSKGRLWLALPIGLFVYDKEKNEISQIDLSRVANNAKDWNIIQSVYEHKGKIYIGTTDGAYAYDLHSHDIKPLPVSGQDISRYIYRIIADSKDRLWLNTNNGIVIYDPSTGKTVKYAQKNGLPHEDMWSRMYHFGNEIITSAGPSIVCFNENKVQQQNFVPTPVFSTVSVNDTSFIANTSATARLRWNESIAFNFISLHFRNASQTQYAYLLEGLDKDWHPLGFNGNLRFSNLPSGNYNLRIKAIDSDGAESPPLSFAFNVQPPFWKTWWFITACILAISGAVYWLYRYRLGQAIRLEQLRMRIATDLHDDIGATLSSISMYSDAVKKQVKTTLPHLEPVLDKMGENSRNMVGSMSDIVWAINPNNDEGEKLLERMENYGKDTCSIKNVCFHFHADKKINSLSLALEHRKNIYLVFKEAMNNALKYANASEIAVHIKNEGKMLWLQVEDNGKGFEQETIRKGNGLENMRQRAKEINGQLNIESGSKGTSIRLLARIIE